MTSTMTRTHSRATIRAGWPVLTIAVAVACVFVVALAEGPSSRRNRATATPPALRSGTVLLVADVSAASAHLTAVGSHTFAKRVRAALHRQNSAFAADARRLSNALKPWLASISAGSGAVVSALVRLRSDTSRLRSTILRLTAPRRLRIARRELLDALSATGAGLTTLMSALSTGDPAVAQRRVSSAQSSFARADRLARLANRALGCRHPCSLVLG